MALDIWLYSIASVLIVSLISLIGIVTIPFKLTKSKSFILFLVSFSAGALLGDAFIHLLPETFEQFGFGFEVSLYIIAGIFLFFLIEKIIHWKHTHSYGIYNEKSKRKSIAIINLVGDGVHNFIDGVIIGVSYLVSIPLGVATTLAVIFHEIPQEIGDFGVLLYGGFSKTRAVLFNLLSALTAVIGVFVSLYLGNIVQGYSMVLLPFAAGGFIYIAGSNLIPELQKEIKLKNSLIQIIGLLLGVVVMVILLVVG